MPPPSVILLASVLKPLNDTRMLGKFGRTLAARPGGQVHVAGRAAPTPFNQPANLHTHALLTGSRLSLDRLRAQWRYWRLLRRLRPDVVVVHAPELLPATLLWQWLGRGRRFVYDVRENYALNIRTQRVYPSWLRGLLARTVRWLETVAARRAAGLILAEQSYANELPFADPTRTQVLENKYQPFPGESQPPAPRQLPAADQELRLLFSGTISRLNGVFEAVALARHLRPAWPGGLRLTIIGFCQQPEVLAELQQLVAADASVTLVGGAELVPHSRVVAEIGHSHVGLLPYQPHVSTARCLPTKLYEYAANGLPMFTAPGALWTPLVEEWRAGLMVRFQPPFEDAASLVARLRAYPFYPAGPPAAAFWASEAEKLHRLVDSIR